MTLRRILRWRAFDEWPGLEHLHLNDWGHVIKVRSTLIGQNENVPFGVAYELNIEHGWIVSTAIFQRMDGVILILRHDGKGNWEDGHGEELHHLAGCIDIDISRTPFTNTLPMRRVAFEQDVPQRFDMAWVALDTMTLRRDGQIYTWLGADKWRYQAADGSFEAILTVDEDKLIVHYQHIFERISG